MHWLHTPVCERERECERKHEREGVHEGEREREREGEPPKQEKRQVLDLCVDLHIMQIIKYILCECCRAHAQKVHTYVHVAVRIVTVLTLDPGGGEYN